MPLSEGLDPPKFDERITAAVAMIGRTGAKTFKIAFSNEDEEPIVWNALALYEIDGSQYWQVAAAMTPDGAVLNLCEQLLDGGKCTHCGRITGFTADFDEMPETAVLREDGDEQVLSVCWYQYDPELKTFRRGCE